MNDSARILVAHHNGVAWLRIEGRGSFQNACQLKRFANERLAKGDQVILIDLEECEYMDSTFMGTLTGIACRIEADEAAAGRKLEIVNPSNRARELLENLGLDEILSIHRGTDEVNGMDWVCVRGVMAEQLFPETFDDAREMKRSKAECMLEAHKALAAANSQNDVRFRDVIGLVERELQKAHL
ncbi:MAG: STAS domain-containing protein [Verrucomicrobiae bacterium]|nr:STAS domain-containing protein [Verrucomicrobiae bacterium]